ncbi:MAG: PorP/SprF family type IX secretion system membrane protein [Saprospiraceae bacterium]|nr:PorP/SprF family type IX secretion system membrane protein [Saprospiraceae bacterium]
MHRHLTFRSPLIFSMLLWVAGFTVSNAQQAPQYTMNMLDKYRFNPAYAGMDASLSITGSLKSQWEGLPGAPKFQNISAHMPVYIANGGAGIQLLHDRIGVEESVGFRASFNYVFETSIGIFSAGFSAGMLQKKIDGSKLRTHDGIYEGQTIIHNDPILSSTIGSGISPNTAVGVYFTNDYIEAGLAVEQLLNPTVTLNNAEETNFQLRRTINVFVEYNYPVNEILQLFPSLYVKTDGIQTQVDFSTRFDYQEIYFGGLTFRGYSKSTIDALALFVGARVSKQLSLAYAYDITLSKLSTFSEGTHEIVIHYNLSKPIGVGKPERIIYNPRF